MHGILMNSILTYKFNFWVFWHDIRRHKLELNEKLLNYPFVSHEVICKTCNKTKTIVYENGLGNYY